ncbi:uncharacterized protein APUU_12309A [Aspergillus puulaauensis]|uniref:Uncharacterized protein n=1 Tax=Aspergillus puulaauensis TaxID=1220207 RepID=A0A7R8AHV7_9EURO|nr:uncharacterized protein APUU_12309A [Aspergillus puulaauensis]BCS19481.1 hypothetical protein APUU_12309A [Aspergillus puulaauensis]
MPDDEYTIRVDHVSDILFLPIPPSSCMDTGSSPNDWKGAGNEKFIQGKYYLAIDFYSQALNSSPSIAELIVIRQNRAFCFLKTHQFDAAHGLPESGPSEKALYRKAQALHYLQRFQEESLLLKTLELLGFSLPAASSLGSLVLASGWRNGA